MPPLRTSSEGFDVWCVWRAFEFQWQHFQRSEAIFHQMRLLEHSRECEKKYRRLRPGCLSGVTSEITVKRTFLGFPFTSWIRHFTSKYQSTCTTDEILDTLTFYYNNMHYGDNCRRFLTPLDVSQARLSFFRGFERREKVVPPNAHFPRMVIFQLLRGARPSCMVCDC